ncbi:MAG: hypothetical protein QXF26_08200, partial [Candidatus Bathyarchaeia archaeon]
LPRSATIKFIGDVYCNLITELVKPVWSGIMKRVLATYLLAIGVILLVAGLYLNDLQKLHRIIEAFKTILS